MKKLFVLIALTITLANVSTPARADVADFEYFSASALVDFCDTYVMNTIACSEASTWVSFHQSHFVDKLRTTGVFAGPGYAGTDVADSTVWLLIPSSYKARATLLHGMLGWLFQECAHSGWHGVTSIHQGWTRLVLADNGGVIQDVHEVGVHSIDTSLYRMYCDCDQELW